jgi:lipopolysaccharide transport system ATP-binding protein
MGDVSKEGRTVLFVSHNMAAVSTLCSQCVVLNLGTVKAIGPTEEAIRTYIGEALIVSSDLHGVGAKVLTKIEFIDKSGISSDQILCGSGGTFRIHYNSISRTSAPQVSLSINTLMGSKVASLTTAFAVGRPLKDIHGEGYFECQVESLPLIPGIYQINVALNSGSFVVDHINSAMKLSVLESNYLGRTRMPTRDAGVLIVKDKWVQHPQKAL